MKKLIVTLVITLCGLNLATAQIKKPALKGNTSVKTAQLNKGLKIPNIKNISTSDLHKKNLPVISITEIEKNAKPLTSWKITPMRLKDTYLEVYDFLAVEQNRNGKFTHFPCWKGEKSPNGRLDFYG